MTAPNNSNGNLDNWDPSHFLNVANEADGGREWTGELHLVAIYDHALSAADVATNFAASANYP